MTKLKDNAMKRLLMGFVLAVTMMFLHHDASAATRILNVLFRIDMVNTGVDQNASGKISGNLIRNASGSNQQLKLALANLDPNTTYQLSAFIGDDPSQRTVADFTTDAKGAFAVTYVQKCPGTPSRNGQPLPDVLDPISHIHQLDILKAGSVLLTGVIGDDLKADCARPTVSFTVPVNGATSVALNQAIAATFSEPMNAATITRSTFALKNGTRFVSGTVTFVGATATFTPTSALAPNTTYTAIITTRTKDLAGNALESNFLWSFTTGPAPDTTAPTVSSTDPANAATAVALNKKIAATFSEAMDPLTISTATFTLNQGATPVAGTVTYAAVGTTATFSPASALAPLTTFTATITTGAKDLAGNVLLNNFAWSFTTGAAADTTPPTVVVTVPANAATGVAINQAINTTFSEAMDPATISTATFLLSGPGATPVTGTVAYDVSSKIATFTPASNLAANTVYGVTITTGAKDLAGNALTSNLAWAFTTAAATAGQAPVVLGSATTFAVLAGSTVTSSGATTVNGDLGVSPGTAVTGFFTVDAGPGIVNGAIHAGDSAAAQAELDLTTAYNDAAGRTVGAVTVAGNLGGLTLTPGLYKSTSSLEISSGDLTLDAQGDANAIFIFQMASTLTTTSGRQVILSGGAKAANIVWQVGSSATLGTTSVFKGTILADQAITLTTGATLDGRALARIAAVTLDANVVTAP